MTISSRSLSPSSSFSLFFCFPFSDFNAIGPAGRDIQCPLAQRTIVRTRSMLTWHVCRLAMVPHQFMTDDITYLLLDHHTYAYVATHTCNARMRSRIRQREITVAK